MSADIPSVFYSVFWDLKANPNPWNVNYSPLFTYFSNSCLNTFDDYSLSFTEFSNVLESKTPNIFSTFSEN
jgi:hypothetical protein